MVPKNSDDEAIPIWQRSCHRIIKIWCYTEIYVLLSRVIIMKNYVNGIYVKRYYMKHSI